MATVRLENLTKKYGENTARWNKPEIPGALGISSRTFRPWKTTTLRLIKDLNRRMEEISILIIKG